MKNVSGSIDPKPRPRGQSTSQNRGPGGGWSLCHERLAPPRGGLSFNCQNAQSVESDIGPILQKRKLRFREALLLVGELKAVVKVDLGS